MIGHFEAVRSIQNRTDSVAFGLFPAVSACVRADNLHNSLTVYHTSHNTHNVK